MAALDTAGRRSFIDVLPGLLIGQPGAADDSRKQRFDAVAAGKKAHRRQIASRTKSAGAWMLSLFASIAIVTAAAAALMMNAPVPHQHLLDIAALTRR